MTGGTILLLMIALAVSAIAGVIVNQRRRLKRERKKIERLKELARKIRDGETVKDGVYDFYDVGPSEINDVFELEDAGMVALAVLLHPVYAAWRITDQGRRWLDGKE